MSKKLNEIVESYITNYKNENEFLQYNNLDKNDFNKWVKNGHSEDGFFGVMNCYCLAGDATNDNYMRITSIDQITSLLLCEINESNFNDVIEMLNADNPDDQIDINDTAEVLETFCEFVQETAVFPIDRGKYKGGLMLVINED